MTLYTSGSPVQGRPPSTQAIIVGVVLLVMVIIVGSQSGCGSSARHTALTAELAALKTARDTYTRWDREYQMSILDKAPDRDTFEKQITAYRTTIQMVVLRAFELASYQLASALADDNQPMPKVPAEVVRAIKTFKAGQDPPIFPCSDPRAVPNMCLGAP